MPKLGTKNILSRYFWAGIFKKLLPYLNSTPYNLYKYKILCENKNA